MNIIEDALSEAAVFLAEHQARLAAEARAAIDAGDYDAARRLIARSKKARASLDRVRAALDIIDREREAEES